MTAVEWVIQYLNNVKPHEFCSIETIKEILEQAKEMEKQQIEILKNSILELFEMVHNGCNIRDQIRANEIYYETYKKDNQ